MRFDAESQLRLTATHPPMGILAATASRGPMPNKRLETDLRTRSLRSLASSLSVMR